jgi:nucleotide-binding universal stress UspA family protein
LPYTAAGQQAFLGRVAQDVERQAVGRAFPGLVDVHVAQGSSNEDVLRSAREISADLIVLGRRDGGAACLSRLREMLRDSPCHVLVVHPSGHAAVA